MSQPNPSILAIDAGTSSLKAVLYEDGGGVLASSTQRYGCQAPQPGWAEADPEAWWAALLAALADLAAHGWPLARVEALALTGQMHTAVLLDAQGEVVPPTILWLDRRAAQETEDLQQALQLPPYQLNSTYSLPKLLWLARHRPASLARVRCLLWPKDYLRFRLTGQAATDLTEPGGAALLDWTSRTWATERLAMAGMDPDILPPIRPADGDGGALQPAVARSLGLSPDARVVVGMGDVAALFGAAPSRPGRVTCSLGSSSMVFAPLPPGQEVHDPKGQLYVYPFGPYPMLGGVSSTTGASLQWVYEKLARGEARGMSFEAWVTAAVEIEPGAGGACFLPYLAGERTPYWSDDIRGGFYGLQLGHDDRHLARAVMEGVAWSLRHLLDLYQALDQPIDEIALAGGGVRTPGWPAIIADATQRDVLLFAGEETVTRVLYALCQAHLARRSFDAALLQTFDEPVIIRHRPDLADIYDEGYRRYRAFARFAWQQALGPEGAAPSGTDTSLEGEELT